MAKKIFIGAGICMAIGGVLLTVGVLAGGLKKEETIEKSYTVTEEFRTVYIDGKVGDVFIAPSLDGKYSVEYKGTEKQYFSVAVVEDELKITEEDARKWYEHIGIHFPREIEVTLRLPIESEKLVRVITKSGDIEAEQVRVQGLSLKSQSGDIKAQEIITDGVRAKSDSGDIHFEKITTESGVNADSVSGDVQIVEVTGQGSVGVRTTSGDVQINGVTADGSLGVQTTSGEIAVKSVDIGAASIHSVSGNMRLNSLLTVGETRIKNTSGNVWLTACDGCAYNVQTSSGNVTGTVLTSKIFYAQSSSGTINVPKGNTGDIFNVKTLSGNISLKIAE